MYVTFGPIDAISLWTLGLASASPSSGKDNVDPAWFADTHKKIIVVPDKEEYDTGYELACQLSWRGDVLKLDYPPGMKDPNDFLKAGQEDLLREQLI